VTAQSQTILAEPADRAARMERLRAALPGPEFELALGCEVWRSHRVG
jgi:hypothetical protein